MSIDYCVDFLSRLIHFAYTQKYTTSNEYPDVHILTCRWTKGAISSLPTDKPYFATHCNICREDTAKTVADDQGF